MIDRYSGHSCWCANLIICSAKEGVDYTYTCWSGCTVQLAQMWGHFNWFVSVKTSTHKSTRQQRCRPSVSCRFKAWVKVKRENTLMVLIQAAPMGITEMRELGHCREQILTLNSPAALAPGCGEMTTVTKFFRHHFLTVGSSVLKSPAKIFKLLTEEKDMFLSFILKLLMEQIYFSIQSSVTSFLHLSIMTEIPTAVGFAITSYSSSWLMKIYKALHSFPDYFSLSVNSASQHAFSRIQGWFQNCSHLKSFSIFCIWKHYECNISEPVLLKDWKFLLSDPPKIPFGTVTLSCSFI